MKFPKTVSRNIARALLICFAPFAIFAPVSQAAMVGTHQILSDSQSQLDRAHLKEMLNRADLTDILRNSGVDPDYLSSRVDNLTNDEVALLNEKLEQLPAGGTPDILGTAVFIFLVLLLTDILGYTDIFPFVKKTVN